MSMSLFYWHCWADQNQMQPRCSLLSSHLWLTQLQRTRSSKQAKRHIFVWQWDRGCCKWGIPVVMAITRAAARPWVIWLGRWNPDLLQSLHLPGRLDSASICWLLLCKDSFATLLYSSLWCSWGKLWALQSLIMLDIYSISGLYIYRPFSVPVLGLW